MTDSAQGHQSDQAAPAETCDADRDSPGKRTLLWYVLGGLIFLAWLGFLVYCGLAGNPPD